MGILDNQTSRQEEKIIGVKRLKSLQTVNLRSKRNYEPRKVILGYADQMGLRESGNYRPVH
jgi:hypothetical protein